MFNKLLIAMVTVFTAQMAFSSEVKLMSQKFDFNFAAPVASDVANLSGLPIGSIVFDVDNGQFKGLAPNPGNPPVWTALSASSGSNVVSSYAASNRIESLQFGGSSAYNTPCDGTPTASCSLYNQSSNWASVTRTTAGSYSITFSTSTVPFASTPVCVCNAKSSSGPATCAVSTSTSSGITVEAYIPTVGTVDSYVNLICFGPQF